MKPYTLNVVFGFRNSKMGHIMMFPTSVITIMDEKKLELDKLFLLRIMPTAQMNPVEKAKTASIMANKSQQILNILLTLKVYGGN